ARHIAREAGDEGVADGADEGEALGEAAFGEVVEEDAADAARLAPVLEEEVVVAPALEARVLGGTERNERVAADAMEVDGVVLEPEVGRHVHAVADPDPRRAAG